MMFDSQHEGTPAVSQSSFEPLARSEASGKKALRSRAGMLLTSTSLVAAATAMMTGEAAAQAPAGFAPAPADVVSYVQLSNGSVLVQLANQQSLLVTSNNFFIDGTGVLFLSPAVTTGIAGGGAPAVSATTPAAVAPLPVAAPLPQPLAPADPLNIGGNASSGVIFEDTEVASSSGGIMGMLTGGPGLFGLGTLGTIAAVGLGGGAILFAANAIRSRLQAPEEENSAASITATDTIIERGGASESVTYAITDFDGIDESDLVASVQAALDGASTVASIFPSGAEITTERSGSGLFDGTEDTYGSINVTLTGEAAEALNLGSFPGPAVSFTDAKGNEESVNLALEITDSSSGGGSGGGSGTGTLELDQADGSTHEITQGGSKLFKATDPDGDTINYSISNNPSGIGIDSNTGLVVVANTVAAGSYTITVTASSTGADGSVETDTETYNITVTEGAGGSGGSGGNSVNADFDSSSAGFDTLSGVNITDNETADSNDNELEIVAAAHLANSYIMDGLAGDDTVYFSEAGATYHLDPTWVNGFEDVSGFETLELLSDVHLEINGGVLDSESTGDIEHLKGSGNNRVTIVNNHADFGLDVTITDIDTIDMNNYDLTLDNSDLSQITTIEGDTQSTLVFTGQFTYDFAEGLIMTKDVTRLGLDAGNYDYSLTLDGVSDEDVREIYAYGANEIEGNVMIDARANAKISLIDLAGDEFTTGGIDGDSNIFVTYDDTLEILGGDNDDDVDVTLDSDIEDGEFQFDGGGDNEDTLNINLNGDEIDTRGYGRSIDHVEYIDIDAPDGDGEAHLQFNGSGTDMSDIIRVDVSDVKDDSSLVLDGDRSALSSTAENISSFVDSDAGEVIDGFVADEDVIIHMTSQDDTITLTIGESESQTTDTGLAALLAATDLRDSSAATKAEGSQAVDIHLGGGDDVISLILGSVQSDEVTLHFSRANNDDHDTVSFTTLNDLGASVTADGLTLDFADDITTVIAASGTVGSTSAAAAGVSTGSSQQGAVILFDSGSQHGFIYDHDGDGELSDGDTLVDLTTAGGSFTNLTSSGFRLTMETTEGSDQFNFSLDQGDLSL